MSRREWLVIESSMKKAVFAPDELRDRKGYIPRDVAEQLLGRDLSGMVWFTNEESAKIHAHPEWRDTEPPKTFADRKAERNKKWWAEHRQRVVLKDDFQRSIHY